MELQPLDIPVIKLLHRVNAYLLPEVVMSPLDKINFKLEPDPRTKTNGQQMLRIPGVFGYGVTNVYSDEKIKINRIALAWSDEVKGMRGFVRLYLNIDQTQELLDEIEDSYDDAGKMLMYVNSSYNEKEKEFARNCCLGDDSHLPSFLLCDR